MPVLKSLSARMQTWSEIRRVFFFMLCALVLVAAVAAFFPRTFHTNDDMGVLMDVSAGFRPAFMSALLGSVLSFFYTQVSPVVPWYGIMLYSIHVLSLGLGFLIIYRVTRQVPASLACCIFISFLSFYLPILLQLTFTSTALFTGLIGLLTWILWMQGYLHSGIFAFAGGVTPVLALSIRFDTGPIVVIMAAPALAWMVIRLFHTDKKRLWRGLLLIMAFPVATLPVWWWQQTDMSPGEREFDTFNKIRGEYHGFPIDKTALVDNRRLMEANQWSGNDVEILNNWIFFNEEKFNEHTIRNIFEMKRTGHQGTVPVNNAGIKIPNLVFVLVFWGFLLFFAAVCSRVRQAGKMRWLPLSNMAWVTAIFLYLQFFMRFPERISLPMHLGCLLLFFVIGFDAFLPLCKKLQHRMSRKPDPRFAVSFIQKIQRKKALHLFRTMLVFLLLISAMGIVKTASLSISLDKKVRVRSRLLAEMRSLPAMIQLVLVPDFPYYDPLVSYPDMGKLLTYGWTIFSPRFYHSIKTGLGVDRATDTIRAFVDNPQALIAVHIPPNCNADGTVVLPGMDGKPETMVDPPAATSHPLQLFLTAIKEWYGIDAGATARHVLRLPTYNVVWYNLVRNGSRLREQDGR